MIKNLTTRDRHLYDTLHLPLTEEWKEFDEQVNALAKLTSDSLNVKLLQGLTELRINEKGIKGSIHLLEKYLKKIDVDEDDCGTILYGLRMVQTIRSTGTVHRKSTNFDDALKRYNLRNLTHYNRIREILLNLTESLTVLHSVVLNMKQ